MRRKFFKLVGLNALSLVVGYLLSLAEINTYVSPFFLAFVFALIYVHKNWSEFIFGAVIGRLVYSYSIESVIITLNLVIVIVLIKFLTRKSNKRVRLPILLVGLFLSLVSRILFSLTSAENLVLSVINLLLVFAFFYAFVVFFRAISRRGTATKLAMDELLGLALLLAPIALATSKIYFGKVSLSQVVIPLLIFLTTNLLGGVEALTVAIIAGIGVSFKNLSFDYVSVWTFYAVSAVAVKRLGRVASVFAVVIVDVIMGFYFGVYETYGLSNLITLGIAGVIYLAIPKKVLRRIRVNLYDKTEESCLNEIVVQEERSLKERVKRVSLLFQEMHKIYKNMIIGKLDNSQVVEVIQSELTRDYCLNCSRYKSCYEGRGLAVRGITELVKKGVSKKKVSLVDTPTMLASACVKTNQIIFQLNARLEEYEKQEKAVSAEDEGKILMSNQLLGVSEILDEFGTSFAFGERASADQEKALIESYLYNDIIVKECAIFSEYNSFKRAVLVVKNVGYKKKEFLSVANLFFKTKTKVLDTRYTKVSGWQIVTITPAPKYTYLVGVAKRAKNEKSGDTFSETVVDEKTAMFAIVDGKGCGEQAGKISELTLNLIENFYKAGFSTQHIMDNVNKVMAYRSGENFSAVDVCVIDLEEARADFVKRGGTPSVIKKQRQVRVIEGQDLPVGVMENSKSRMVNYYLNSGDVIVLASDGVFDAFNTSENFAGFINNTPAINMQEFTSTILSRAITLNNGKILDDMTVLAVKVIINR